MTMLFNILEISIIINVINASLCTSIESNTCNILYTKHQSNVITCDNTLPNCNITCLHSCSNKTIITEKQLDVHIKVLSIENANMIIYAPINGILSISTANHKISFHSNTIYSNSDNKNIFFDCIDPLKCEDNKILNRIQRNNRIRHLLSNAQEITMDNITNTYASQNVAPSQTLVLSKEITIILIGIVVICICCACIVLVSLSTVCMYIKRDRTLFALQNSVTNDINKLNIPERVASVASQSRQSITPVQSPQSPSYPSQISLNLQASHSVPIQKQIKFTNMSTHISSNSENIQNKFMANTPQTGLETVNIKKHKHNKRKQRSYNGNIISKPSNRISNHTLAPPIMMGINGTNLASDSEAESESNEENNTANMPSKETEHAKDHKINVENEIDDTVNNRSDTDETEFTLTINKLAFECHQKKMDANRLNIEQKNSGDETDSGRMSDGFMTDYMNAPISHCGDHKESIYNLPEAHNNDRIVQQIIEAQASI